MEDRVYPTEFPTPHPNPESQPFERHSLEVTEPGTNVKHFKRALMAPEALVEEPNMYLYHVICTATRTDTCENLVVYRAYYGEQKMFARPMEMFISYVDRRKYPKYDGQEWRMCKIEEDVVFPAWKYLSGLDEKTYGVAANCNSAPGLLVTSRARGDLSEDVITKEPMIETYEVIGVAKHTEELKPFVILRRRWGKRDCIAVPADDYEGWIDGPAK